LAEAVNEAITACFVSVSGTSVSAEGGTLSGVSHLVTITATVEPAGAPPAGADANAAAGADVPLP
jgi:hypothetical protein